MENNPQILVMEWNSGIRVKLRFTTVNKIQSFELEWNLFQIRSSANPNIIIMDMNMVD